MPHFIKTGYWEKAVKTYKGWLDLEQLISSVSGSSSTLQQVSNNGNQTTTYLELLGGIYVRADRNNTIGNPDILNVAGTYSYYNGQSFTIDNYSASIVCGLSFEARSNSTLILNNDTSISNNDIYSTVSCRSSSLIEFQTNYNGVIYSHGFFADNAIINLKERVSNIYIQYDSVVSQNGGITTFFKERVGIFIDFLKSNDGVYTAPVYGIWDQGNDIRFDGLLYVGTSTNPATTNVAMSVGKPINYQNSTTSSAGASSGKYLTVYDNGTPYKIALLNNA